MNLRDMLRGLNPFAPQRESDVDDDEAVANSRVTDETGETDGATTDPRQSGKFVGRVSGQDPGYPEDTGAEQRRRRE